MNINKNKHCNLKNNISNSKFTEMNNSSDPELSKKEHTLDPEIDNDKLSNTTKLLEELTNQKDKYIRLFAEFENYKKRIQKERLNILKSANENLFTNLLPVIDDFERGINEIKLSKGITLIIDKLNKILKNHGLKKINTKIGDDFDTDLHEAITQIKVDSNKLKGKIVRVVEYGYSIEDKIIRHAKVIIGK